MQRLMTKVLEETKSKETALEAHLQLETELENLTSSLFTEANRMVAVERFARARAEEKMKTLEESAVDMAGMFGELQVNLRDKVEKFEEKDGEVGDLRRRLALANGGVVTPIEEKEVDPFDNTGVLFSDGNSVTAASNALNNVMSSPTAPIGSPSLGSSSSNNNRRSSSSTQHIISIPHTLTTVMPYQEFLSFITYLRQLRITVLTKPLDHPSGFPNAYVTNNTTLTSRSFSSHPISSSTLPNSTSTTSPIASTSNIPAPPTPAQLLSSYLPLSSHLSQPFLKRCLNEDTDPTLRLDLSPGLGFLSRRTISSSILDGNLIIEPIIYGAKINSSNCTMCGCDLTRWWRGDGEMIFSGREERDAANALMASNISGSGSSNSSGNGEGSGLGISSTSHAGRTVKNVGGSMLKVLGASASSWGFSSSGMGRKGSASGTSSPSVVITPLSPSQPPSTTTSTTITEGETPTISVSASTPPSSLPVPLPSLSTPLSTSSTSTAFSFPILTSQQIHLFRSSETSTTRYAICPTYCLSRLRSVCEFWNYVRVVERGLLLEEGFRFAGRERKRSFRKEKKEAERKEQEEREREKVDGEEEIVATFAGADEETEEEEKKEVDAEREVAVLPVEVSEEKKESSSAEGEETIPTSIPTINESITASPISNPEASVSTTSLTSSTSGSSSKLISKPTIPPRRSGTRPQTPVLPLSSSSLTEGLTSTSSVNLLPTEDTTTTTTTNAPASPIIGTTSTSSSTTVTTLSTLKPKLPPRRLNKKISSSTLTVTGGGGSPGGGNGGGIIDSSAGWEDRCWTEVVRLKEKMFWSRITGSE